VYSEKSEGSYQERNRGKEVENDGTIKWRPTETEMLVFTR